MPEAPRSIETGSHLQRVSEYCALMAADRSGSTRADPRRQPPARRRHGRGSATRSSPSRARSLPAERREVESHTELGPRDARRRGRPAARHGGRDRPAPTTSATTAPATRRAWPARRSPSAGGSTAVADAFDALTTDRVYRGAVSVEQAVETLKAERGRHFEPRIVDTFLDALDDGLAIRERFPPPPEEQPGRAPEDKQLTLQAAAATLAITPSRLRRWADEGRIPAVRTAGGHRRFSLAAVRRLAAESGVRPTVRPVEPPASPCRCWPRTCAPTGASSRRRRPPRSTAKVRPGWFASAARRRASCASGRPTSRRLRERRYARAIGATAGLMRRAHLHGASLLERHAFLERLGQVCVRTLVRTGAERDGDRRHPAAVRLDAAGDAGRARLDSHRAPAVLLGC